MTPPDTELDVLIVGAGLAGLAAAGAARTAGASVRILEAGDDVGGRARTDTVDGFLLDRGFQVLLDAYPQVAAQLDLELLEVAAFAPGATIWNGRRLVRVVDPRRQPTSLPATITAGVAAPRDAIKLLQLLRRVQRPADPYELLRGAAFSDAPEIEGAQAFASPYGFSARFIRQFATPFFGGIVLDDPVRASNRMIEFVLRMFASGGAVLPAKGMGAIARQLADQIPPDALELNCGVETIGDGFVVTADGRRIEARSVIVAAGPWATAKLVGEGWGERDAVGCTTLYFDAAQSPVDGRMLVLNGVGASDGPVNEVAVPSDVQASYAPDGRALIGATCIGDHSDDDTILEGAVRGQLQRWFGASVDHWRTLQITRVPRALPVQQPPWLEGDDKSLEVTPGLFVAGDHRDTASIDGALRTGFQAGSAAAGRRTN